VNAEANSNITAISLAKKDKDSVLVAYLKEHGAVEVDSTKQKSPSFTANIVNPTPPISIGTSASPQDSIFAAKEEGTKPNVAVIDKNVNIDSQNKPKDVVNIMEVLASPDSQIINKPQIVAQDSAAIKAVSAPAAKVAEADSNKNLINQKPASQTIDDSKPHPIGGFEAIRANLKIPQLVKDGKIKGTILINVTVDQKGVLKDIKFVKLLMNKECNAAALEAVRSVKWESGTKDGKPVTASIDVPIEFQP
jgi:TonB family protein